MKLMKKNDTNSSDFFGIEEIKSRPPVVTICGPRKFYEVMLQEQKKLEREFCIVHMPNFSFSPEDLEKFTKDQFDMLHEQHYRKMLNSDYVYIIDVDGYIGDDTAREIAFALKYEIPIKYLETPNISKEN